MRCIDGTWKIGISRDPEMRAEDIAMTAGTMKISSTWIFANARQEEAILKKCFKKLNHYKRGVSGGTEFFTPYSPFFLAPCFVAGCAVSAEFCHLAGLIKESYVLIGGIISCFFSSAILGWVINAAVFVLWVWRISPYILFLMVCYIILLVQ